MDLRLLRYFVAVAEEGHIGRAAARLNMTQPPLSRAIKQLETEFGCQLLRRSANGVTPTATGAVFYRESRALLDQADQANRRIVAAAASSAITVGVLADSADDLSAPLASAFRKRHPAVDVRIREGDFADPTIGLRAGLVDVALTRAPFEDDGIHIRVLRSDRVGVVLCASDDLAQQNTLQLADLADRRWFRFPDGTDPQWCAYWCPLQKVAVRTATTVVRTVQECLQAVLWSGAIGLAPVGHALPKGLVNVPLVDMPPSDLVIAWKKRSSGPLAASFAAVAVETLRRGG